MPKACKLPEWSTISDLVYRIIWASAVKEAKAYIDTCLERSQVSKSYMDEVVREARDKEFM